MRLTLGRKLGLGFGVILALMVFSAVLSYLKASDINQVESLILTLRVPTVQASTSLETHLNWAGNKGRQAVLAGGDAARRDAAKGLFDGAWTEIDQDVAQLTELAPRWSEQENRDRLAHIKEQLPTYRQTSEAAMGHAVGASPVAIVKAGEEFTDTANASVTDIKKTLKEMIDSQRELLTHDKENLGATNRALSWTTGKC